MPSSTPLRRVISRALRAASRAAAAEHRRMEHVLRPVHVLDEALNATGKGEVLFLPGALVDEHDAHAVIEERELAQPPGKDVVVVVDDAEDLPRSEEMHFGTATLRDAGHLERRDGLAAAKLHL